MSSVNITGNRMHQSKIAAIRPRLLLYGQHVCQDCDYSLDVSIFKMAAAESCLLVFLLALSLFVPGLRL